LDAIHIHAGHPSFVGDHRLGSWSFGMGGDRCRSMLTVTLTKKGLNTHTTKKTPRAICGVLPFALVFVSCDSIGASHTMKLDRLRRRERERSAASVHDYRGGTKQAEWMFKKKNALVTFLQQVHWLSNQS
jgi:hypothetical protein